MRRHPLRWVPAILLCLAVVPGSVLAQEPSPTPDPAAIALVARSVVATRAATSMHVSATGSGPVAADVARGNPATLDGSRMEIDIDLARPAFAARIEAPFLGWSGVELRAVDGRSFSNGGSLTEGRWLEADTSALTDQAILGTVPGVGLLLEGQLRPALLENVIRRQLDRASASIALVGERACDPGTCRVIHLEGPLSADPTGLADLLGSPPSGAIKPGSSVILADVLVDVATDRIDTVEVTMRGSAGDTSVHLVIGAYERPVTIEPPPADLVIDGTGG